MSDETLTDEQGAWLCELMDWEEYHKFINVFHVSDSQGTITLNEAFCRVMNRAVEKGYRHLRYDNSMTTDNWYCYIGKKDFDLSCGTGSTRFIAFVNSLMEAER